MMTPEIRRPEFESAVSYLKQKFSWHENAVSRILLNFACSAEALANATKLPKSNIEGMIFLSSKGIIERSKPKEVLDDIETVTAVSNITTYVLQNCRAALTEGNKLITQVADDFHGRARDS